MKCFFCFLGVPVLCFAQFFDRPNVILFLADDMGIGDCSAYQFLTKNTDDQQVFTPAMQRLANMGMLFSDAHTPSSRCTPTRYALLTGRYAWRTRMKYGDLHSPQGDPLIEEGRPTLASLFRTQGYATALIGKWHLGLRYTNKDGKPSTGWEDADLSKELYDGPCDHGFKYARFTSGSQPTSGPVTKGNGGQTGKIQKGNKSTPTQAIGHGAFYNRKVIETTDQGKQIIKKGEHADIVDTLGSNHPEHAIEFLTQHVRSRENSFSPFFLYFSNHANHTPDTPTNKIGKKQGKGAAKMVSGKPASSRLSYVYEIDAALGRLLDYLKKTNDPRRPSKKLIENTIVVFTSDIGVKKTVTTPTRSNKVSCDVGEHRVPLIISWPSGQIGNGNGQTPGGEIDQLTGLQDLYATFSEILGLPLPNLREGQIGAEDSVSISPMLRRNKVRSARPMFFSDHKDGHNPAACAIRMDDPIVGKKKVTGKWKLFFDDSLLKKGVARPTELFELSSDPMETRNCLQDNKLVALREKLVSIALLHRNSGGHRLADLSPSKRIIFDWTKPMPAPPPLTLSISGKGGIPQQKKDGLGIQGNASSRIDSGEGIALRFEQDVLIESIALKAGEGSCGGSVTKGKNSPLAIYCTDAHNDAKDQQGVMSDLGIIKKGERLILDAGPHLGVEPPGSWKLQSLVVRPFDQN